eukprot:3190865-Amphidinium_carterae.1
MLPFPFFPPTRHIFGGGGCCGDSLSEEEYNAALPHALSPSTASSSKVAPLELPPPPAKWLKLKSDREHGRAEP